MVNIRSAVIACVLGQLTLSVAWPRARWSSCLQLSNRWATLDLFISVTGPPGIPRFCIVRIHLVICWMSKTYKGFSSHARKYCTDWDNTSAITHEMKYSLFIHDPTNLTYNTILYKHRYFSYLFTEVSRTGVIYVESIQPLGSLLLNTKVTNRLFD